MMCLWSFDLVWLGVPLFFLDMIRFSPLDRMGWLGAWSLGLSDTYSGFVCLAHEREEDSTL
jgi:hypothetical protein